VRKVQRMGDPHGAAFEWQSNCEFRLVELYRVNGDDPPDTPFTGLRSPIVSA
jgi:hypothetical protein